MCVRESWGGGEGGGRGTKKESGARGTQRWHSLRRSRQHVIQSLARTHRYGGIGAMHRDAEDVVDRDAQDVVSL